MEKHVYAFKYEPGSNILNLRLTGFWTMATMEQFTEEFVAVMTSLAKSKRPFVVLSDCREYPVQSAEIGEAWSGILGPTPTVTVPYAIVVGSVLNKIQAKRALTAPNVRLFTEMRKASEWLSQCQIANSID